MCALDLQKFWQENRESEGKPFSTDKPRAPVRLPVDDHWLIEEMALPSTVRYYEDREYRAQVHRECNDRCEEGIGLRPFTEQPGDKEPLRIEQIFGSKRLLTEGGTPWLEPGVETPGDLVDLLERIEALDDDGLRELILSTGVEFEKRPEGAWDTARTTAAWSRGPATVGTSVVGTTRWCYWLVDEPALMERFYEDFADVLIRYHRILAGERGVRIRGFGWLDDNCALVSDPMYRKYCQPVLRKVFEAFCPDEKDWRFQHSDSAMGHLLPALAELDLSEVNLGPTLTVQEIRHHMPTTLIGGQIAPMTLRNGTREDVAAEVQRDFKGAGSDGGLVITTAGSVAGGTSFESMRWLMEAVQDHCRYD